MAVFKDYRQDPDDTLDWIFDWGLWLGDFESITTATFVVDAGITVGTTSHSQKTATVWLSGGTEGQVYKVTSRIVTDEGRTVDRSITIRCTNL